MLRCAWRPGWVCIVASAVSVELSRSIDLCIDTPVHAHHNCCRAVAILLALVGGNAIEAKGTLDSPLRVLLLS